MYETGALEGTQATAPLTAAKHSRAAAWLQAAPPHCSKDLPAKSLQTGQVVYHRPKELLARALAAWTWGHEGRPPYVMGPPAHGIARGHVRPGRPLDQLYRPLAPKVLAHSGALIAAGREITDPNKPEQAHRLLLLNIAS